MIFLLEENKLIMDGILKILLFIVQIIVPAKTGFVHTHAYEYIKVTNDSKYMCKGNINSL